MALGASRIVLACLLGFGLLLWPGATPARDFRQGVPAFHTAAGQEVVNGNYGCYGTVFTDEQPAQVNAGSYLTATSGITDGFSGTSQSTREVPADLDAMAEICEAHIAEVVAELPALCTLGPIERERGEFGNGATTVAQFDLSCQGTRDQVIGVIGAMSRLPLTALLP